MPNGRRVNMVVLIYSILILSFCINLLQFSEIFVPLHRFGFKHRVAIVTKFFLGQPELITGQWDQHCPVSFMRVKGC